jgi:uncharacterized protein (TIGR02599 family)
MKRLKFSQAGFTLTEVLVSSALIVGIMALMLTAVDQTRRTITNTTSRVSQFQSARVAFEAMTRTLGQATLNTYYDLDRSGDANQNPLAIVDSPIFTSCRVRRPVQSYWVVGYGQYDSAR